MDLPALARLLLIYAHLLLCVFALHDVLVGDWRALKGRLSGADIAGMHTRITWLLGGLWITGLAVIAIDTGFDAAVLVAKPKLIAKLATVALLTLNGVLLQHWCFPRLSRLQSLGAGERSMVLIAGGVSTASWLVAAFLGIAKSLSTVPLAQLLALFGATLAGAALSSLLVGKIFVRRAEAPPLPGSLAR